MIIKLSIFSDLIVLSSIFFNLKNIVILGFKMINTFDKNI